MTYTYCIVDPRGYAKIGISNDPMKRLYAMQIGSPEKIRLHGVMEGDHEKRLHAKYKEHRVRGEWFTSLPEILAEFDGEYVSESERRKRIFAEEVAQLVTVGEAAKIAGVTYRTMQRWIEKGAVSVKRSPVGKKLLIPRKDVEPQAVP